MSALVSYCGRYRWTLDREIRAGSRTLLWVMLNPSTADASIDDPTIRKCRGFTDRLGYDRFRVVNLYAWRATNPYDLMLSPDPVGVSNDAHIGFGIATASLVLVAWGGHRLTKFRPHKRDRIQTLAGIAGPNQRLWCLGTTKDGSPRHPLMLPYSAKIQEWNP